MLWVIQDNLFIDNKRDALKSALQRLGIPVLAVQVRNNTIHPDIPADVDGPIITNGSVMLSQIAIDRGWWPGSLFNAHFSYDIWSEKYQGLLLNKDAVFSTLASAPIPTAPMFVRPVADTKSFNGRVFTPQEFGELQPTSRAHQRGAPTPETNILMATPKKIGQEHRHYIVDGQIVTSSRYKLAGQPNFHPGADQAVLDVVAHAVSVWQPARAFVMDTYVSGSDIGIVEIGGICHAGLYEADLIALAHALDVMAPHPKPIPAPRAPTMG